MKILSASFVNINVDDGPGINERNYQKSLSEMNDVSLIDNTKTFRHKNRLRNFINYLIQLSKSLRKERYDCATIRLSATGLELFLLYFYDIKVHLRLLNVNKNLQKRSSTTKLLIAFYIKKALIHLTKSKIISCDTPSNYFLSDIENEFNIDKNKVIIIPNASEKKQVNINKEKTIDIIYAGIIDKSRNLQLIIDVIDIIKDRNMKVCLLGNGPYFDEMKNEVIKHNAMDNIHLMGKVEYSKVKEIYAKSKFGIDLSLFEKQEKQRTIYGSFSQKIPQYLMNNIIPIVWNIDDLKHIKESAVLIDPKNKVESLRSCFRDLDLVSNIHNIKIDKDIVSYEYWNDKRLEFIKTRINN